MRRRVVEVTSGSIDMLPARCRACLFWELGTPRPIDLEADDADALAGDPEQQKVAWWRATERGEGATVEGTSLARAVVVGDDVAGYALVGPSRAFAPRRPPVPAVSRDALLLATVWVAAAFRGQGIGRLLVLDALKLAEHRDLRAVEAYGDRRYRERACVTSCTWLLHEGFAVAREHPRYPLLRLDLKSTARWTEPIEIAVEQALNRLGPEPAPAPQQSR